MAENGREGMASMAMRNGLTSADVCQAIRQYGVVPKWMRDLIEAQRQAGPRPKPKARTAKRKQGKQLPPGEGTSYGARRRRRIFERDGFRCVACGWQPGNPRAKGERRRHLTLDHIVPRSKGGRNTRDNLQTLCNVCNCEKGDRVPSQFAEHARSVLREAA